MKRKRWEASKKLEILQEAENGDVVEVCRKHNVSTA